MGAKHLMKVDYCKLFCELVEHDLLPYIIRVSLALE